MRFDSAVSRNGLLYVSCVAVVGVNVRVSV